MSLLHTHSGDGGILERFFEEVLLHGLFETLNLLPFLFLTYLLMELIEHKASERINGFMHRAGVFGPFIGGIIGVVPQCGFSAAASNFYAARVISSGTLIAVFLSASDEMLPILISGGINMGNIAVILIYKCTAAVFIGFTVDLILRIMHKGNSEINIDAICDEDNCHCERGILYSAVHHTLTISGFVLLVTVVINTLVTFVGTDAMANILYNKPVISHMISAVFGLIPNCAASVALTTFYTGGMISVGTMMSGLFSGAGVGVLVLFKMNKNIRENLFIVGVLILSGTVLGLIFDLLFAGILA